MKRLNKSRAMVAALIVWLIGVSAYTLSFMVPLMEDVNFQANLVLSLSLIPAGMIGAHFYYRKYQEPGGLHLGIFMFLVAMILDALITVPVFVMPEGGSHLEFFTDPGFWLVAMEYILIISAYPVIKRAIYNARLKEG